MSVADEVAIEPAQEIVRQAMAKLPPDRGTSTTWYSEVGVRTIEWADRGACIEGFEVDGKGIRREVDRAAIELGSQKWVCAEYGAEFEPIVGEQLVAVSPGLLRSAGAVDGSRYSMSGQNSGWMIIEEGFQGTVDQMHIKHATHVADERPELVRFLALPVSWRFLWDLEGELVQRFESR